MVIFFELTTENLLANSFLTTYPAGTRHFFRAKCFYLCSKVKYFLSFRSLLGNSCLCTCQMPVYIYQLVNNRVCLLVEQVMHHLFLATPSPTPRHIQPSETESDSINAVKVWNQNSKVGGQTTKGNELKVVMISCVHVAAVFLQPYCTDSQKYCIGF